MKARYFISFLFAALLLSCSQNELQTNERSLPNISAAHIRKMFLEYFNEGHNSRSAETTSEDFETFTSEEFEDLYIDGNESFKKHYEEVRKIIEDEDNDIETTEVLLNDYLSSIEKDSPDEDDFQKLQICISSAQKGYEMNAIVITAGPTKL